MLPSLVGVSSGSSTRTLNSNVNRVKISDKRTIGVSAYMFRCMFPGWFCRHTPRLCGSFKVNLCPRETHEHQSLVALPIGASPLNCSHTHILSNCCRVSNTISATNDAKESAPPQSPKRAPKHTSTERIRQRHRVKIPPTGPEHSHVIMQTGVKVTSGANPDVVPPSGWTKTKQQL